jgi:membrane protein
VAKTRIRSRQAIRAFVELWAELLGKHNLLTWASAIAFQVLVALVPLTVLALGILGALGEQSVWKKQLSPPIERRLPGPTWDAVNYAAKLILTHSTAGLIAFGAVLTIWEISGSVRAIMGALNQIYETDEKRSIWVRYGISIALAIAIGVCLISAILVLTVAKHLGGSLDALVSVGRWIVAVLLVGVAVELLVRFAPAERRPKKWVTLGSTVVVVGWVVASLIFRVYVSSVANFRSTFGSFVAVLVLTAYLYTSAIVFLVGVEADELIRAAPARGEHGFFGRIAAALGQ